MGCQTYTHRPVRGRGVSTPPQVVLLMFSWVLNIIQHYWLYKSASGLNDHYLYTKWLLYSRTGRSWMFTSFNSLSSFIYFGLRLLCFHFTFTLSLCLTWQWSKYNMCFSFLNSVELLHVLSVVLLLGNLWSRCIKSVETSLPLRNTIFSVSTTTHWHDSGSESRDTGPGLRKPDPLKYKDTAFTMVCFTEPLHNSDQLSCLVYNGAPMV